MWMSACGDCIILTYLSINWNSENYRAAYVRKAMLHISSTSSSSSSHAFSTLVLSSAVTTTVSAKLYYMDTGYGHPPTDELATILQLVVQHIHHQRTKICHNSTSWHVEMLGSMWWICCTTSCRIVVTVSVGGVVQHVRSRCPWSGVWHLRHCQITVSMAIQSDKTYCRSSLNFTKGWWGVNIIRSLCTTKEVII